MAKKLSQEDVVSKLQDKFNGEVELLGEYKNTRTNITLRTKTCGHEWEVNYKTALKMKHNCLVCYNENVKRVGLDKLNKVISSKGFKVCEGQVYKNNTTDIKFVHGKCGKEFYATPTTLMKNLSCPMCRVIKSSRLLTTDEFKEKLYLAKHGEYSLVEGSEYTGANNEVRIVHNVCGHTWDVRASHILKRSGCPNCVKSKGADFISRYFEEKDIPYIREYKIDECKNVKPLPFDFAVLNKKGELSYLVEYDGIQHFKPQKHFGGEEKFNKQLKNDDIKNNYCFENNIPLVRIPYTKTKEEILEILNKMLVS